MDWNYLFSLTPEDLSEEEKDGLYNTVTWFNCDGEDLSVKKCVTVIKITQEVLKYKGEQVEVLLHKLDELATQQGEEEGRRIESDTEVRSSRSRKSSSIELESEYCWRICVTLIGLFSRSRTKISRVEKQIQEARAHK